ncbi:MAG: ABC transporter permease subunit, partial [Verrucomicrobiota bacterium]|nr:ABC transporter permease subunit [Verrucomicrobiota bacterium]
MITYIARRLLQAIPTLWLVATATFVLLRIAPGGPFDDEKPVSPEIKAQIEAHYGLDEPLIVQYFQFFENILRGDLGPSYKYAGWDVQEIIVQSFPVSLELGLWALLLALIIGIPIGSIAALRHKKSTENILMGIAAVGICLPSFVIAPILILVFSLLLGWFNPIGWVSASDRVLPVLSLSLLYVAYIARLSRGGMLDVLQQDFIRTAQAKGITTWLIIVRHALRTALLPVLSYIGPTTAGLISGSFVVETIFFIPGLGPFFVNAAL